jgi:hypothetical protein
VTSKLKQRTISYLLGDLPEQEQTAFEREFFADPAVFEQLVQTETALVDDYVRQRLSPRLKKRFEEYYLAHPRQRERANFADALATKIDEIHGTSSARQDDRPRLAWRDVLSMFSRRRVLQASMVTAMAVLMLATGWLFVQTGRLRRDLAETQIAKQAAEQRERDLQQQLSAERAQRASGSTSEPQPPQTAPPRASTDSRIAAAAPVVSLLLSVRSVRGSDASPAPTLVIPAGTRQVRVQVALDQQDYPRYQLALKPVAGPEVFTRQHLNPQRTNAGPSVILTVPADLFAAGDYLLSLSGESASLELEEVGKLLFRVEKK